MKKLMSLCLVLVLAGVSLAAPKVKGENSYEQYKKIVLQASEVTSQKAQFLWRVDSLSDSSYRPDLVKANEVLYVWAKPGSYRVYLIAVDFDTKKIEEAEFTFKVSGTIPDPKPPEPKPPTPDDPLLKTLKSFYTPSEENAEYARKLASVYRTGVSHVDKSTTTTALLDKLRSVSNSLLEVGNLKEVRVAIRGELQKVLPYPPNDTLTDDHKKAAKELFGKLSVVLDSLGGSN